MYNLLKNFPGEENIFFLFSSPLLLCQEGTIVPDQSLVHGKVQKVTAVVYNLLILMALSLPSTYNMDV